MKKSFLLFAIISVLCFFSEICNAQAPEWAWAKGATGSNGDDLASSVAVDASGNTLVTGWFNSPSITFGSTTLTNTGTQNVFLTKYDANGNVIWAKKAGGTTSDGANSVTVDASGNIYIAGFFNSPTISFGSISLTNSGNYNFFVAKYDANGNIIWARNAGGTSDNCANAVAVDNSGNVYVTGYFANNSTMIFGTTTLTRLGYCSIFTVKYNASGTVLWAKKAGGSGDDESTSIAVDVSGNIYLAGYFGSPSISFGLTTLTNSSTSGSTPDTYLAKYDLNGNVIWVKKANGLGEDRITSVALDHSGNIYVSGNYSENTLTFDSITLPGTAGYQYIFLTKYDATGNVLWAKSAGETSLCNAISIVLDTNGNIFESGSFSGNNFTIDTTILANVGGVDIYLAKYDDTGNLLWAKSAGGSGNDWEVGLGIDVSDNAYLAGFYSSTSISFGTFTLTNASNNTDIFFAKCQEVFSADAGANIAISCGNTALLNNVTSNYTGTGNLSYNWAPTNGLNSNSISNPSATVTTNTTYFVTVTTPNGLSSTDSVMVYVNPLTANAGANKTISCGSTVNLDNVTSSYTGTGNLTYSWSPSNGLNNTNIPNPTATVTSNTTYVVTVTTPNGCSATDNVIVNVNPLTINVNNVSTTCGNPVILNTTNNYTGSGTLTYNWQPATGLSATNVSNPSASPITATNYTVTLSTPNGCVATDQATVSLSPLPVENICFVEFDTTTSENSINWSTNLSANIDSVNVYRETSTNVFTKIGTAPANQSKFIDASSNPFNQSYSYKISAKDICSLETNLSSFHTTITLLSTYNQGTNTYGFTWSAYEGLTIANYYLYGITSGGVETLIGTVNGNQYFYNYTNPDLSYVKYYIGFNTPACGSKTNHLVKSNYVQAATGIEETAGINNLVFFNPNPVIDNLQIKTDLQINTIEITDITGRLIYTTTSKTIDCSNFSKGVYYVKVQTDKGIAVKKFIKQ